MMALNRTRMQHIAQMIAFLWWWPLSVQAAEIPCADLKSLRIAADAIALPSRGATIESAHVETPASRTVGANGAVTPAFPEYCKVTGTISSVDPAAAMITFQVNLPTTWNGKALQYGGKGSTARSLPA